MAKSRRLQRRTVRELRAAVNRGITLLDAKLPDWRRLVNLKDFDFTDPCRCVLGWVGRCQVNGDNRQRPSFFIARDALRILPPGDIEAGISGTAYYGFDWSVSHADGYSEARILHAMWRKAIAEEE